MKSWRMLLLTLLIVGGGVFSANSACGFFAEAGQASGKIPAQITANTGENEGVWQYDASGYAVASGGGLPRFGFDMVNNPGPLAKMPGNPASNFAGGKYTAIELTDDLVLFRAGDSGKELGQWFTRGPAESVAQVRIDLAVRPQWIDPSGTLTGTSPLNTSFAIKIPKGTTIYEGPVGYQSGIHLGGQGIGQIFVPKPWKMPGVEVIGRSPLR